MKTSTLVSILIGFALLVTGLVFIYLFAFNSVPAAPSVPIVDDGLMEPAASSLTQSACIVDNDCSTGYRCIMQKSPCGEKGTSTCTVGACVSSATP